MKIIGWLSFIILTTHFASCSDEGKLNQYNYIIEYLNNWEYCYSNRFVFPHASVPQNSSYIKGSINGNAFSINDFNMGFLDKTSFEYSYSTTDSVLGEPNSILSSKIHIGLIQNEDFRQIAIVLSYDKDSLNYEIQEIFSKKELKCASNFTFGKINFQISTNCTPSGSVKFSTFFSDSLDQKLTIESFAARKIDDKWNYELEFSADELFLSNEIYNSMTEDVNFITNGSPEIIRNIIINNLLGKIHFQADAE